MVVRRNGNYFFGSFLTDHIFVKLFLDLVGRRDIVDGKYRFRLVLLLFLDLGLLAPAESAAEQISQIQKADGRSSAVSARLRRGLLLFIRCICRLVGSFRLFRLVILLDLG